MKLFLTGAVLSLGLFFQLNADKQVGESAGPEWYTFNVGMQLAQEEGKILLVDFYTDWCYWCKKMDEDAYAKEEVQDYLEQYFICVKLNPETDETVTWQGKDYSAAKFSNKMKITGYPTTAFFDSKGSLISTKPGYRDKDAMLELLEDIRNM